MAHRPASPPFVLRPHYHLPACSTADTLAVNGQVNADRGPPVTRVLAASQRREDG